MLTKRTQSRRKLKPRSQPSNLEGFFVDIQHDDVLRFLESGEVEISRGDRVVGKHRYRHHEPEQPLSKVAEGDRVQPDLFGGKEQKLYSVKSGKLITPDGKTKSLQPKKKKSSKSDSSSKSESSVGTPAKSSNLPPGAKWITIHPHGDESKGVPVIIQERPDGTAVVIGGAGGKLNQLQLGKLRSPEEWKQKSAERKAKREAKEAERRTKLSEDEQASEDDAKATAKEYHQSQRHANALETIKALDENGLEHGLSEDHKQALEVPPAPGAEPEDVKRWQQLTREAAQVVKRVQQAYEHKLVTDHEARAAARLADTALSEGGQLIEGREHVAADADGNELSNMVQLPDGRWLVRNANGEEADKVYESWTNAAKEHAGNVAAAEDGGPRSQPDEFYNPGAWVRSTPSEKLPEGFEFKPEAAAAIAALSQQRKAINKSDKAAEKAIAQGSPFVPQSFDIGDGVDSTRVESLDKLEADARTLQDAVTNSNFLSLVDMVDPKGLQKHVTFGGYAKLGEIASEVLKQNPLDRLLVDKLGHNEAAKVLAYQIQQNVTPEEYQHIAAAQAAYHAEQSTKVAQQAYDDAKPLVDQMSSLHDRLLQLEAQKGDGEYSPDQLIEIDNLSYQAKTLHDSLQKQLETVLGQLQASAAMSAALEGKPKSLRFSAKKDLDDASTLVPGAWSAQSGHAVTGDDGEPMKPSIWDGFGLDGEDFSLEDGPDGQLVSIKESGLKRLAAEGYSDEDKEAYEQAIAIKRGDFDEDFYSPDGFAYRSKSTFTDVRAEAEQFNSTLDISSGMDEGQLQNTVRAYIGARVANGENPLDVRTDIFSPELYSQMGIDPETAERTREALNKLDQELIQGKRVSDSAIIKAYQTLGDAEAAKQRRSRKTDDLQQLHSQTIDHEAAIEAAHRSLAAFPMARCALKAIGDLSAKERRWLREHAITEIMGETLEEKPQRSKADTEPETDEDVQVDIFGNVVSAASVAAEQREDEQANQTQWQRFSKLMGGDYKAYEAVRDRLKGQFHNRFAAAYGGITGKPLLTGEQKLQHIERLLLTQMSESQRQEMLDFIRTREQSDVAKVRSRVGGKFARELDNEWLAKYQDIKGDNRQMSLLTADTGRTEAIDWQRTTLGSTAEEQLSAALKQVIPNFEQINNGVGLYPEVNWAGKFVAHQRGLKFLKAQKKVGVHFSAGSGKSAFMLGAFAQLHGEGKIKKAIVAVPSAIIGQMVGEAATFLEPGKFKYNGNIGWNRDQRIEALKDDTHVHVTTRESLANDLLHLVEKHTGISPDVFQTEAGSSGTDGSELPGTTEEQRRSLMLKALQAEGINPQDVMLAVDEAHDIARRKGVKASKRSLALDALTYHSSHYIHATGTPLKNDLSEIHDFLRKVDPDKFGDQKKFLAKYGQDTEASQRSLQRILGRYAYAVAVKPTSKSGADLSMRHTKPKVELTDYQKQGRSQVLKDYELVQCWYNGELTKAMKKIRDTGGSRLPTREDFAHAWDNIQVREAIGRLGAANYENMSDEQKRSVVGGQAMAAAALKNTALNRLYHRAPFEHNAKAQHLVKMAQDYVHQGKPGVVFSASSEAAEMLKAEMEKRGLRVGYVHGGLNADQKTQERLRFSPANPDEAETDILIATDAAQAGLNLQRGKFLVHYDVPPTQKAWDQRSARIFRRGQTDDVDVHTLMAAAPEEEIALARMERKGRASSVFQGHDFSRGHAELLDDSGLAGQIEQMRAAA